MKYFFAFFLLLLFACCSEPVQPSHVPNTDSIAAIAEADSLRLVWYVKYIDSLEKRVDVIAGEHFKLKEQDFPYATYYHNNWYGIYCIRDEALTVMVDELGELTIISCLDGQDAGGNHQAIAVQTGSGEYKAEQCLGSLMGVPGTGNKEYKLFGNTEAWKIAQVIAQDTGSTITVRAMNGDKVLSKYTLADRDRAAISDCYELALTLQLMHKAIAEPSH